MRRVVSIGIVCFWLIMLGLLVRRSWVSLPPPPPPPVEAPGLSREQWMSVYHEGVKIGYTHVSFTADQDGFSFSDDSLLRLVVMDSPQIVRTRLHGHANADWSLRDVELELSSGAGNLRATGVVELAGLRLEIHTGGTGASKQILPVAQPLYLPSTLQGTLNAKLLQPGNRFEVLVFDPISLKNDRLALTVQGQEALPGGGPTPRQAWRVRQEFRGFETTAWMDDDGSLLREEGPMGMVLVRTSAAEALRQDWSDEIAHDLVASAAVPVARPIDDPRQRMRLRLRLAGIALDKIPADEEQILEGAVLTIERSSVEAITSYDLPCTDTRWRDDLQPTAFVQSDHPRVRDLARAIVGTDPDAARVAVRLNDWVYERLRKVPTISIPNALQVLQMGQGDCNEHAVLLAALGRAAGIPTRMIAGAVYINGAFFYHAWCEMWLGRWVSIDPVLGQFPADATHIKFVVGGPDEQIAMMHIIGHLGIEVLDDTAEPPGGPALRQ